MGMRAKKILAFAAVNMLPEYITPICSKLSNTGPLNTRERKIRR
jgi:hypothetical protein